MGNFAQILKELRKKKGLTQLDLSNNLHISRSSIGMYESGDREPDFETLEAIADFFNVDMDYLLGRESGQKEGYYLDPEAAEIAQEIYEDKDLRMLFDASRKVSKNDIQLVIDMVKRLKGDE